jgi:xylulokinase
MIVLGIDVGSSSVKVSLFDALKGEKLSDASYPPHEMEIISLHPSWAEQNPNDWMSHLLRALQFLRKTHSKELKEVQSIGISYQMHGLVLVDRQGKALRDAIIWCDSRAVQIGDKAFKDLGSDYCLSHLHNSPGNFTASKLKWVKENEPQIYEKIHKMMLPGDFIAYQLTNEISTTKSGLSEGVFWDFKNNQISEELLHYYGIEKAMIPEAKDSFADHGRLSKEMAEQLGLTSNIPITYKAGDQPNNALSLNVLTPGAVAATAGTSGVVYGVTQVKEYDPKSRVNTFLHVNHTAENNRLGILLNLNSVGILNSWVRQNILNNSMTYPQMNEKAAEAEEGANGLLVLPFGNGAERLLGNKNMGAGFQGLNLNRHQQSHILRGIQEGIAYAFNYGLEIMKQMGLDLSVIRAGQANLFLSPLFRQTFSNLSGAQIELYNTDGAEGAARGAAIGAHFFSHAEEAFNSLKLLETVQPDLNSNISAYYQNWKQLLDQKLKTIE